MIPDDWSFAVAKTLRQSSASACLWARSDTPGLANLSFALAQKTGLTRLKPPTFATFIAKSGQLTVLQITSPRRRPTISICQAISHPSFSPLDVPSTMRTTTPIAPSLPKILRTESPMRLRHNRRSPVASLARSAIHHKAVSTAKASVKAAHSPGSISPKRTTTACSPMS